MKRVPSMNEIKFQNHISTFNDGLRAGERFFSSPDMKCLW